jgi:transposase
MRGEDEQQQAMYSYISPEQRVPQDHPLRPIRRMVNQALKEISPALGGLYSRWGRPSIPPERLQRASLLQVFYSIRSERLLMEQLDYNLLFRWFVGLNMDDRVWDHSTFSKNRDRFLASDLAGAFFAQVLEQAGEAELLSDEHFSVDGTLVEAWASMKSVRPREQSSEDPPSGAGRNPTVDFRGEKRSNATHRSTTDPEARLYRKSDGQETKLCFMGHVLMENRNGLAVNGRLSLATGKAERQAAVDMLSTVPGGHRITVGADKAYDTGDFVGDLRDLGATPHVARKAGGKRSAIDGRTTRHTGYVASQRVRKRVEEIFGWLKTVANLRKVKHRGQQRVGWLFTLSLAAYNLIRMRNLMAAASP